jgi:hypothetical protein
LGIGAKAAIARANSSNPALGIGAKAAIARAKNNLSFFSLKTSSSALPRRLIVWGFRDH